MPKKTQNQPVSHRPPKYATLSMLTIPLVVNPTLLTLAIVFGRDIPTASLVSSNAAAVAGIIAASGQSKKTLVAFIAWCRTPKRT